MAAKLTWKSLTSADTVADPAVRGERYALRYRRRKGGIFAELRWKVGPGKWTGYPLGRVPSEWEAGLSQRNPELFNVPVTVAATLTERQLDRLYPDRQKPVPVELALGPIRDKARALVAKLVSGHDPRGGQSADSLKALIDEYLKHAVVDQRERTRVERRRHLLRDWEPFHARAVASLTKGEIAAHLLRLKADHGPIASNRSRATLRAMYAWADGIGRIETMPAFPPKVGQEQERERELGLDELRAIWQAAGDGDHGVIVRLLMLTGQRREEVGGMRWSELDLDRALWSLPGERTKNKRPHVVPLSSQAVALLRAVERRDGRDNLFGNGVGSYSGWSRSKARLDGRAGVADWRLHDLRHAWSTHVHELGVPPHVVEASINHLSGFKAGVAGRYNKAQYMVERARAQQLWADHLLQSKPAKVIPLRA